MTVSFQHLHSEYIDKTFRSTDQRTFMTDRHLAFFGYGEVSVTKKRHNRAPRLDVGRRIDDIVGKASRQDIPEQRFIALLVGPEHPVGRRMALVK